MAYGKQAFWRSSIIHFHRMDILPKALLFAICDVAFFYYLENHWPIIDRILTSLNYRDGILLKAVYALLNQTDAQGLFFPINDAQKGMSWLSREVVAGVDIAYFHGGRDPMLLSIAKKQNRVLLDETGFAVARDMEKGLAVPYKQKPCRLCRWSRWKKRRCWYFAHQYPEDRELCAVFKYSAHGMGHGHFDKLSYSLYDELGEIIQDYGAARWVNIDQKGGGRYLPENNTFAKQSIAHNTVVLNEISHYEGSVKKGEAHHPVPYFFNGGE